MKTDHGDLEIGDSFINNAKDNRPVIYVLAITGK